MKSKNVLPILENYKRSVKILAIGNSFSVDAMQHLAIILKDAGVESISLGNFFIGGCTLETHYNNIKSGAVAYEFYVNRGDGWTHTTENIDTGILYDDWDIITFQQASAKSGQPESYTYLEPIIEHVKATATNPNVKFLWHMTWAYQGNSTHPGFANYNFNQKQMYEKILGALNECILPKDDLVGIIPSGMAIQKLRESYLGDTVTRDGFHLSYGIGRYTAALTWFRRLTGADISDITAIPDEYPEIREHLEIIKEAANYACENNPDKAVM